MKIINKINTEIINDKQLNLKFLSVLNNEIKMECKILTGNFFLDSFNYFPITEEYNTFSEIYSWGEPNKYNNFYTNDFLKNFKKNMSNYKNIKNAFILGSSPTDNYYRNMITFLPRIFFIKENKINLVIHRNLSNKFKNFIFSLCKILKINIQWVFLDDNFYKFSDSQIPQFLKHEDSINLLKRFIIPNEKKKEKKIYITRQNSNYRNLINEADLVAVLKKKGFEIFDLNQLDIVKQMNLFHQAKLIISVTSSSLTNIIFSSKGTRIIEISPHYQFDYENSLKFRFRDISNQLDLEHDFIEADPINIENKNKKINSFIPEKILNESNYYKNLLIKIDDINKIL